MGEAVDEAVDEGADEAAEMVQVPSAVDGHMAAAWGQVAWEALAVVAGVSVVAVVVGTVFAALELEPAVAPVLTLELELELELVPVPVLVLVLVLELRLELALERELIEEEALSTVDVE